MNKWDQDNLEFILYANTGEFEEWMQQATRDDIDYALQLIQLHRTELKLAEMEFLESESDDLDCTLAIDFINRVKEKL
jgi:hypothetical protein